jgi:GTPase SAR1 family protein
MAVSNQQVLDLLGEAENWSGSRALQGWQRKMKQRRFRIAVFGLVNRGKSALINALVGSPLLRTGPLNGVTQKPAVVGWQGTKARIQVELVDTPGLGEVGGETRSQLAWSEAERADLILFVISGDLSQQEYEALLALRGVGKPLFLVFNKVDLYPSCDRELIYGQLTSATLRDWIKPEQIFLVAAAPSPYKVRQVWLDGRVTETWEYPPPQVESLRQQLGTVIAQEGERLIRISVLRGLSRWQQQQVQHLLNQPFPALWLWIGIKAVLWTVVPMLDGLISLGGDVGLMWQFHRTYRLPFSWRLWRSVSQAIVLNVVVAALAHGLWQWGWGSESVYGVLAWWSSCQVKQRLQKHMQKYGWWRGQDPQTLLRQVWAEVEPHSLLAGLEPRHG